MKAEESLIKASEDTNWIILKISDVVHLEAVQ